MTRRVFASFSSTRPASQRSSTPTPNVHRRPPLIDVHRRPPPQSASQRSSAPNRRPNVRLPSPRPTISSRAAEPAGGGTGRGAQHRSVPSRADKLVSKLSIAAWIQHVRCSSLDLSTFRGQSARWLWVARPSKTASVAKCQLGRVHGVRTPLPPTAKQTLSVVRRLAWPCHPFSAHAARSSSVRRKRPRVARPNKPCELESFRFGREC